MTAAQPIEPTMKDVARAAGVGVATVDRVLNQRAPVRAETAQRVVAAAEALGFRRAGLLRQRVAGQQARSLRLGVLLQSVRSPFYRGLAGALHVAVGTAPGIQLEVLHQEDLMPRRVAQSLGELGSRCDALAVVAADHPHITQAVEAVNASGVPVWALVSDLATPAVAGYVGADNRKMGAMAAWTLARLCRQPGKLGLILGSHRYLCQEQCEVSFRSHLRERAGVFQVLDTLVSLEDEGLAHAATLELLHLHPDLAGVYVAGGGVEGVIEALREVARPELVAVCHDLTGVTRQALLDGCVTVVLSHPLDRLATSLLQAVQQGLRAADPAPGKGTVTPAFEVYTSANV